jgi:hypothetical protein
VEVGWLAKFGKDKLDQSTTKLFLIVGALALQGVLNTAIDKISAWIAGQSAP